MISILSVCHLFRRNISQTSNWIYIFIPESAAAKNCAPSSSRFIKAVKAERNTHIRRLSQSGTGAILVPLIKVGEECVWSTWPSILMTNESFHLLLTLPHKTHHRNNIDVVMLHCSNTVNMSSPGLSSYDKKAQSWSAKDSRYKGRKKGRESWRGPGIQRWGWMCLTTETQWDVCKQSK